MESNSRPDGGWGWVVALAAFLTAVIIDGVKYSFGLLFIELIDTFHRSKGETSLIMSVQLGALSLSGPIAGALANRFGCAKVVVAGTIIAFVGFLASAFATSLPWLYITFGVFGGFGFCLLNIPPFIMIARYFDKHLALAMGIGAMGSGVGTLVFNPVSKILIDQYTWRGTLLIEAGFVLNGLLVALVLRPPPNDGENTDRSQLKDTEGTSLPAKKEQNESENGDYYLNRPLVDGKLVQRSRESLQNGYNSKPDMGLLKYDISETWNTNEGSKEIVFEIGELKQGCVTQLEEGELDDLISDKNSDILDTPKKQQSGKKRWLSLEPLRNPGFIVMIVSNLLSEMGMNTPFAFLPDMMIKKGFQKEQAVWVMFLIGLMSTISRVAVGFIADLPCMNRVYLCNSLLMTNGVLLILSPFCFNYASFVAFGVLFGFTAGSSNVMRGVLLPELFGVEYIADLIGISMFFSAIASFAGLPKTGALFDATGSYIPPFIMSGSELFLSGVLIFTIPSVMRCWKRHQSKQHEK